MIYYPPQSEGTVRFELTTNSLTASRSTFELNSQHYTTRLLLNLILSPPLKGSAAAGGLRGMIYRASPTSESSRIRTYSVRNDTGFTTVPGWDPGGSPTPPYSHMAIHQLARLINDL